IGTAANQVQWAANVAGGFAASNSKLIVNLGGSNAVQTWGANGIGNGTGALILSSVAALADVEVTNPMNLNGAIRTVQVDDNGTTFMDYATLSGVISGAAGSGLTKTGGGLLYLS